MKSKTKKAIVFQAITLGSLHFINRSIFNSSVSKEILKSEQGKCFTWNMGKIFYRVYGTGDRPLLLLHSATCFSSGYDWNQLIADLGSEFQIYVPDLPGCGRSEKPKLTYTNFFYAQFICDFIEQVVKKPADVAASGLTGSFLISAASLRKDLVKKVILINPPRLEALLHTPDQRKGVRFILSMPIIGTCIYNIANSRSNIEYRLTERYLFNPFKLKKRAVDACYEAAHLADGNGKYFMASLDGNFLNWDIRKMISKLDTPITIVYGSRLPQEKRIAESYQKRNEGITLVPMKNTGLLPQLERADLLSRVF